MINSFDDDEGDVYLNDSDIIDEVILDDEDLPDVDDDEDYSCDNTDYVDTDDDMGVLFEGTDDSMHVFTSHTGEIYTVACSPTDATLVATGGNNKRGASGSKDTKGFVWKLDNQDWTVGLGGHEESVSCIAFSHDGQLLASGGLDSIINIWDVYGNHKHQFVHEADGVEFEWVRWHPRGHLVLAGSTDCTAFMWNADTGKLINTFSGHGGSVTCGDFTSDGKIVCTGSEDATFRIWNPIGSEAIHVVRGHSYHTKGLTCLAISSDSSRALTCAEDGSVKIVNVTAGKMISSLSGHSDFITGVEFAPSMPWAATGGRDEKLIIWDLSQSSPRCICNHEDVVTCLKWIGVSNYLATGCSDGNVRIWDSRSGSCIRTFGGHSRRIESLSLSCNQEFLVSVSFDGTARVFDLKALK